MSARVHTGSRSALRRAVAGGLSVLLTAGVLGLLAPTAARADSAPLDPANPATPTTVTADGLPTVQVNGVVWSQVVVGNTVYAAGKFTSARPAGAAAGTGETVRNNLLAYDIGTGALVTSFAPALNAQALVVTASPDGKRIYVGGDFTQVSGQTRNRVAAFDTATGALVTTFRPSVSGQVRALAATNTTVYLGGNLTAVGSTSRSRLAAVQATNGALLPWAPVPGVGPTEGNRLPMFDKDGKEIPGTKNTAANARTSTEVLSLVVTGNGSQVVAAGRFHTLNGAAASGVGALDAVSGATRPFEIGTLVTNQGVNSAIYSLSTDGSVVYGTGYDYYGPGNLEGGFAVNAAGGTVRWVNTCKGDTYGSFATNGALYYSTHAHDCSRINGFPEQSPRVNMFGTAVSLTADGVLGKSSPAAFQGRPSATLLPWFPTMSPGTYTGQNQASWTVAGNGQYVVYGGEFRAVNGVAQQGLVRYALPSIAPNKVIPTPAPTLTATEVAPGTVRVGWTASSDQDNENLTYRVYRDGDEKVAIAEFTRPSTWWRKPGLAFTDRGVSAGAHTYRVTASDPTGNRRGSAWVSVTATDGGGPRSYADAVHADGAIDNWSFGEPSGSTAYDLAGTSDATVGSGVTPGAAGAISGDADTAFSFDGSSAGLVVPKTAVLAPQTFSVEAWFQTTTRQGGKLIGFGTANTGTSKSYDRHVYMDTAGRINFGVYDSAKHIVSSTGSYNDGAWHHVVASLGSRGLALYLDGRLVAEKTDQTMAQAVTGFWRVGGDSSWSGAAFFAGRIDEVAVYPKALSAAQVAGHFTLGTTGTAPNVAPTAAFTSVVSDLDATVDAGSSTDRDGSIAAYAWAFGDGGTGDGPTAAHSYRTAGTYPVTLTVTDDDGASSSVTRSVTVTAPVPNQPPTAAFTSVSTGLAAALDASSSADPDGRVATWAWDFGDDASATGVKVSHAYAAAGTYQVRLTVTDDDGATQSVTRAVTVAEPQGAEVIAGDSFDRTVTGGLGKADVGGAWTSVAGPSRQSVTPGTAELRLDAAGQNTGAQLAEVSQVSADVRTSFTMTAAQTGNGTYVYVSGRRVAGSGEYRARVRLLADGRVALVLSRLTGTTEAFPGGEVIVPGLTHSPGDVLNVRLQVSGTGTTQLKATVWAAGTTEPATPTISRTDTTAALQAPGAVGLSAYRPGNATAATAVRFGPVSVTAVP